MIKAAILRIAAFYMRIEIPINATMPDRAIRESPNS